MSWKSRQEGGSWASGNPGERGGEKTTPSVGGVWIFSGITHSSIKVNKIWLVSEAQNLEAFNSGSELGLFEFKNSLFG